MGDAKKNSRLVHLLPLGVLELITAEQRAMDGTESDGCDGRRHVAFCVEYGDWERRGAVPVASVQV